MNETNSKRQLAAAAAQATSPSDGMAFCEVSIVAYTSTRHLGPGVVAGRSLLKATVSLPGPKTEVIDHV